MTIKALIFDLDDTLWPVVPVIKLAETTLHAWIATQLPSVVEQYSIDALRERRQALVPTNSRFSYDLWALRHTLLQQVFSEHGAHPSLADEAMQVFAQARNRVTFFDDVIPALKVFKKNYVLGSISNGFADIAAVGLDQHFSVSLAAHQFGCAKPDAKIFRAMIEHLKLSPNELMYIGDDLRLDVLGAQNVGMLATWVNRYGRSLADIESDIKPDLIVKDLQELLHELELNNK
ncbi:HAD family hydrolase [Undibacterium sp. Di24W]|uniref:HAD family hydrolase n=1 Tax=Undibacterium sp. Di24W TaxID=3413033 RepID=UPI003BF025B6